MRTLVVGDIHGAHKALLQVLKKSKFDKENDRLICLGDVADSWSQVPEVFDELLSIKNLVYIMGNHDIWLLDWFKTGSTPHIWISQGGRQSLNAYIKLLDSGDTKRQVTHQNLLEKAVGYFIDEESRIYVHGGFNWHTPLDEQEMYDLTWDRHLWTTACMWQSWIDNGVENSIADLKYKDIFIGHTSTCYGFKHTEPVNMLQVWNLDQGAGWEGKLTLMDAETKEYWQSDIVSELYPDEKGRR